MGFREFLSDRWYRRRIIADFERFQNLRPPANPTRRYIDKLVGRLLDRETAEFANRELGMMGASVVPSLVAILTDERYLASDWPESSHRPAPLDMVLALLVPHSPDEVVKAALPLVKSPSSKTRKTVALHLASVGRAETIPILEELLNDADGYVRSYVHMGMGRAVSDHGASDEFRRLAYDILLPQTDCYWQSAMNDSAGTLIRLDRERAAKDLADERWLNASNPNLHRILQACNEAGIRLPEFALQKLLDEALPLAEGSESYPHDYVVAEILNGLTASAGESVRPLVESLLQHASERIRESAGKCMAILGGVTNPIGHVCELANTSGYKSLSHEQRVVYCAFLFDAEVCNGGLSQFFSNGSGDHASDTLDALRELGHAEAEAALAGAIRLVGPHALETNREKRMTVFAGRVEKLMELFAPLEEAYWRTAANLRQSWMRYATQHPAHFRGNSM